MSGEMLHYDRLRRPIVTEKSVGLGALNKYVFAVDLRASKQDVKRAVEAIFSVEVARVNTLITKGKSRRFRGVKGRRTDVKKAVVTLKSGFTIDMSTGLAG